jgi:hypothetical protein
VQFRPKSLVLPFSPLVPAPLLYQLHAYPIRYLVTISDDFVQLDRRWLSFPFRRREILEHGRNALFRDRFSGLDSSSPRASFDLFFPSSTVAMFMCESSVALRAVNSGALLRD